MPIPALFNQLGSEHVAALILGALLAASLAQAQSGPVKLMVGFPTGGGSDAIARILAYKLKDQLGVPLLVDNKAGAGGKLAAQALKSFSSLNSDQGHPIFCST